MNEKNKFIICMVIICPIIIIILSLFQYHTFWMSGMTITSILYRKIFESIIPISIIVGLMFAPVFSLIILILLQRNEE